jgi:thioredoxin 1
MQTLTSGSYEQQTKIGVVLVDFWAEWCPGCKALMPTIEAMEADYAGRASFYKVDCDQSPELPSQLGIRGIPTILVYKDGEIKSTIVGKRDRSEYENALNALL